MLTKQIIFSVPHHINICVTSNEDFDRNEIDMLMLGAYVPGIQIIEYAEKIDYTIAHIESDTNNLRQTTNEIIRHSERNQSFPFEGYLMIYHIVRKLQLEQGLVNIHSACVSNKEKTILLTGHSGDGKSTIALELAQNHQFDILSGNKTTAHFTSENNIEFVAGTQTMTVKEKDFVQNSDKYRINHYYFGRVAFQTSTKVIPIQPNITDIFVVRITGPEQGYCEKISHMSSLHKLYPFVFDKVNQDLVLGKGEYVLTSTDDANTVQLLTSQLYVSLEQINVRTVGGTKEFICESITQCTTL